MELFLEYIYLKVKLKLAKYEAGEVLGPTGINLRQDMKESLTEDRNPLYLTSESTSPTMLSGQYQDNLGYEKDVLMVLTNGSLQKLLRNQNLRKFKNGKNKSFDIGGDLDLENMVKDYFPYAAMYGNGPGKNGKWLKIFCCFGKIEVQMMHKFYLLDPLKSRFKIKLPILMVNYFWNIFVLFYCYLDMSGVSTLDISIFTIMIINELLNEMSGFFLLMLFKANVAINLKILTTFQECGISRSKALGDEILLWYKILVLAFLGYALIWRRNEMKMDSFWLMIWNQFMLFFYANLSMVGQAGHLNTHWEDLEKREVHYCLLLMLQISYKI